MNIPEFKNKQLFSQVFTHRSYLNESPEATESNERLESLGMMIQPTEAVVAVEQEETEEELKEEEKTIKEAADLAEATESLEVDVASADDAIVKDVATSESEENLEAADIKESN
jgi:dsRNA-specific ribonuclease